MKSKSKILHRAFTLVELIVVIVILAILATIAFLSFSSQSSTARDSTRMADISNIMKGFGVFSSIGGQFPIPDKSINIFSGSLQIGYQGEAGKNNLNMIKFSQGGGKDPLNGAYYTYNTNFKRNKIQILGFLENPNQYSYSPLQDISKISALDYTKRYPYEKGDKLGVFLAQTGTTDITYTPIQDIPTIQTSTGFVLTDATQTSGKVTIINSVSSAPQPVSTITFNGYTTTGSTIIPTTPTILNLSGATCTSDANVYIGRVCGNLFDGNIGTSWQLSSNGAGYVTVDMGSIKNVTKVSMWSQNAGPYTSNLVSNDVDISNDGVNWTRIVNGVNYQFQNTVTAATSKWNDTPVLNANGRYMRFISSHSFHWVHAYEIRISALQ